MSDSAHVTYEPRARFTVLEALAVITNVAARWRAGEDNQR